MFCSQNRVRYFSETKRPSATKQIARILWNPKFYYRIQNSPLPVSILTQIDSAHSSHPISLRYILILSSLLRLSLLNFLPTSDLSIKTRYAFVLSSLSCCMPCPSQSSWLDHKNDIWQGIQSIKATIFWFVQFAVSAFPILPFGTTRQ